MVKSFAKATDIAMTVLCGGLSHLLIAPIYSSVSASKALWQAQPESSKDPCFKSVQRSTEIDDLDPSLLFTDLTCL